MTNIEFKYGNKNLVMKARRYHIQNAGEDLTESDWINMDIKYARKGIASQNRSKAQKERWKKMKEAKILGLQYATKKQKVIETKAKPYNGYGLLTKYYMNKEV